MGKKGVFELNQRGFDIKEFGPNQIKISKSGRLLVFLVYLGKDGATWLWRGVEENIFREGEQASVKTRGENGKTYVTRRCSNNYGRYIEVTKCGRGGGKERVVIPEGQAGDRV